MEVSGKSTTVNMHKNQDKGLFYGHVETPGFGAGFWESKKPIYVLIYRIPIAITALRKGY